LETLGLHQRRIFCQEVSINATSDESYFDSALIKNGVWADLCRSSACIEYPTNPEYDLEINSRSSPMIFIVNPFKLTFLMLVGLALGAPAAEAPRRIDVKRLSKTIEDVVVPLPNEIFGALNKLGSVNWKEYVRTDKGTNFTERPRIALLLGTVIADGFIAVQAEDAPTVKEIGQRVVGLAKGIGVGNSILPHAKAITEAAEKRDWESVRQELDRTQNSVQQAMNEVHDEKLSQLVSLGGWLRGTQILTAVVDKHFSVDGAELLHQPDLLAYFERKLSGMPEFKLPLLHEIQSSLVEVRPMIDNGSAAISASSVKKINQITNHLDERIVNRTP
jgi:hypothetical protein